MAQNLILLIYCTKEDGVAVRKQAATLPNICLQITVSKNNLSIKRIVGKLQKDRQLRHDDYVITIDDYERIIFYDDVYADNVLHFTSLSRFHDWFGQQFKLH